MTNKVDKEKSKYANCMVDKSRFLKQKYNKSIKTVVGIILILNFLQTKIYEAFWHIV